MALPVHDEYRSPFAFTGEIVDVVIDVEGDVVLDLPARAEQAMRAQ
jgi:hypothetical protein